MNGNSFSYKNVSFESFSIIVTMFPWVIPQDLASAAIYENGGVTIYYLKLGTVNEYICIEDKPVQSCQMTRGSLTIWTQPMKELKQFCVYVYVLTYKYKLLCGKLEGGLNSFTSF